MLKFGIISEVDATKGQARVNFPEYNIVSGWLPISVPKILKDKFSIPFDVNEPVWCIMDENCENGIIGGAVANKSALPDGGENNKIRVKFDQSLAIEFDRSNGTLSIEGTGNIKIDIVGKAEIKANEVSVDSPTIKVNSNDIEITSANSKFIGNVVVAGSLAAGSITASPSNGGDGNMSVEGDINISGSVEASGDIKSGAISLLTHKHPGVSTGPGSTGTPIP